VEGFYRAKEICSKFGISPREYQDSEWLAIGVIYRYRVDEVWPLDGNAIYWSETSRVVLEDEINSRKGLHTLTKRVYGNRGYVYNWTEDRWYCIGDMMDNTGAMMDNAGAMMDNTGVMMDNTGAVMNSVEYDTSSFKYSTSSVEDDDGDVDVAEDTGAVKDADSDMKVAEGEDEERVDEAVAIDS
jgi:hypothetical protein